jgi:L-seryl-tRNA(Ser) seleniumtransferase
MENVGHCPLPPVHGSTMSNLLQNIPSVNELLENPRLKVMLDKVSRNRVVATVRTLLDDLRQQVHDTATEMNMPTVAELADRIAGRLLHEDELQLRPTINATGVLLHSGLGRAPLAYAALAELNAVARGYASLELQLSSGRRVPRVRIVEGLIKELTGAEAVAVVNNGAAALLVTLATLSLGREVIVSRGQLIEIGNSFRLPDAIAASGAILREVGTTNRTRPEDYARALSELTGAVLRVHPTNYVVAGMSAAVPLEDMVRIAHERGVPVVDDLGSASLIELDRYGCTGQPVVSHSIRAGADLVLFSGDKLLGGPQCGIIAGRRTWIERIVKHPLMRALRVDKLTLSSLFATLRLYQDPASAESGIPLLQLLSTSVDNLKNRAERLAPQVAACSSVAKAEALADTAYLAGGSVPTHKLPTWAIALTPASGTAEELAEALRNGEPSIVGRVQDGRLLLDLRSVFPRQDQQLIEAVAAVSTEKASAEKKPTQQDA